MPFGGVWDQRQKERRNHGSNSFVAKKFLGQSCGGKANVVFKEDFLRAFWDIFVKEQEKIWDKN